MDFLVNILLPIILYIVAIVLLIVLIVVACKLIKILDKADRVIDNVEEKVNAFNGAFDIIKTTTDGIAYLKNSVFSAISSIVTKVFGKYNKDYKEDDQYE